MITLLSRIFIRDYENTENRKVRLAYGMLCGAFGIVLNFLLFCGKCLAGVLSGSIAVTADALNNLSDAGSSLVSLAGFFLSGKKADAGHPFGHGRIEYIAGLAVSSAIMFMGISLLVTSVGKIRSPEPVTAGALTVAVLAVSILVKLYMFFYNRAVGKKIGSETMKAVAIDSLSDVAATSAVLLSMLVTHYTGFQADGWCGLLVACFVLFAGYESAKKTLNPLLGEPPSREFVEEIEKIVLSCPQILGVHDLVVHDYGPGRRMISIHGEVDGSESVSEAHEIIDGIERELREKLGCEAVIHADPVEPGNTGALEIRRQLEKKIGERYPDASVHDFRMQRKEDGTNLIFEVRIPYGCEKSAEEAESEIRKMVGETWEGYRAVVRVEQSYL